MRSPASHSTARTTAEIVEQANLWRIPTVAIERPDTVPKLEQLEARHVFVESPEEDFIAPRRPYLIGGWEPFAATMRRVLPDVQFLDMAPSDPVFHSFFEINDLDHFPQAYVGGDPVFKGIFEDNDRRKRLMAIINYNTDVSQFWEWSGRGLRPFDQTNEAYKLGVNYLIYGLTH